MDSDKFSKILIVFDFDQTIIDDDSTSMIMNLLSNKSFHENDLYKKHIDSKWVEYLQALFLRLKQQDIEVNKIKSIIENLAFTKNFKKVFDFIDENGKDYDCIIISGSNNLFVNWFVKKHKLPVKDIFANSAVIDEEMCIKIWNPHINNCRRCTDLCKKPILEDYIRINNYKRIFYVGDGENDYCPSLLLRKNDCLFPRINMPLYQLIYKYKKKSNDDIVSVVKPWRDGDELLNSIVSISKSNNI